MLLNSQALDVNGSVSGTRISTLQFVVVELLCSIFTLGNSCEKFPGIVKVETTSKTNLAMAMADNRTLRAVNRILGPFSKVLQFSF